MIKLKIIALPNKRADKHIEQLIEWLPTNTQLTGSDRDTVLEHWLYTFQYSENNQNKIDTQVETFLSQLIRVPKTPSNKQWVLSAYKRTQPYLDLAQSEAVVTARIELLYQLIDRDQHTQKELATSPSVTQTLIKGLQSDIIKTKEKSLDCLLSLSKNGHFPNDTPYANQLIQLLKQALQQLLSSENPPKSKNTTTRKVARILENIQKQKEKESRKTQTSHTTITTEARENLQQLHFLPSEVTHTQLATDQQLTQWLHNIGQSSSTEEIDHQLAMILHQFVNTPKTTPNKEWLLQAYRKVMPFITQSESPEVIKDHMKFLHQLMDRDPITQTELVTKQSACESLLRGLQLDDNQSQQDAISCLLRISRNQQIPKPLPKNMELVEELNILILKPDHLKTITSQKIAETLDAIESPLQAPETVKLQQAHHTETTHTLAKQLNELTTLCRSFHDVRNILYRYNLIQKQVETDPSSDVLKAHLQFINQLTCNNELHRRDFADSSTIHKTILRGLQSSESEIVDRALTGAIIMSKNGNFAERAFKERLLINELHSICKNSADPTSTTAKKSAAVLIFISEHTSTSLQVVTNDVYIKTILDHTEEDTQAQWLLKLSKKEVTAKEMAQNPFISDTLKTLAMQIKSKAAYYQVVECYETLKKHQELPSLPQRNNETLRVSPSVSSLAPKPLNRSSSRTSLPKRLSNTSLAQHPSTGSLPILTSTDRPSFTRSHSAVNPKTSAHQSKRPNSPPSLLVIPETSYGDTTPSPGDSAYNSLNSSSSDLSEPLKQNHASSIKAKETPV